MDERIKKGKVSNVTFRKYENTLMNIQKYFPNDTLKSLTRKSYQAKLNDFALKHADASVERFNIRIRSSLRNAVDEGIISYDFTQRAVIKGHAPSVKEKDKFLDYQEFEELMNLASQRLDPRFASRFMVVIAGATGLRFAELLGA